MIEFFLLVNFLINIINLCLLISILRTEDNNLDLILDLHRGLKRLENKRRKK